MLPTSNFLSLSLPPMLADNVGWWVAGLIVVVGLFVLGLKDVLRLSGRRIWAIGGVVFDESIRKRVLLIAPLAMLGVVVVSQLQRPTDELEAVRAITKFCLFATGLVVVTTTIILTCTNLPREIENRVIFTIVTKPTTRLEIIAGKITGFARVSAAILIMMGLFTWGYLTFREWQLRAAVSERLEANEVTVGERSTFTHYRDFGLLEAKTFGVPAKIDVLGRTPGPDGRGWITASGEQEFLIPFDLKIDDLFDGRDPKTGIGQLGVVVVADVDYGRTRSAGVKGIRPAASDDVSAADVAATTAPTTAPYMGPIPFITEQPTDADASKQPPLINVQLLGRDMYTIVAATLFNGGKQWTLPLDKREGQVQAYLAAAQVQPIYNELSATGHSRLWVGVTGVSAAWDFSIRPGTVKLQIVEPTSGKLIREFNALPAPGGAEFPLFTRGRVGRTGQQVRGTAKPGENPLAVLQYRRAPFAKNRTTDVPFEMVVGIERSGADIDENDDTPTTVDVEVRNLDAPTAAPFTTRVVPESRRPTYFNVPAAAVAGGNFDVLLRCKTEGHWIELMPASLSVVTGAQPFAWNLFKSSLVLWLMSILVVVIALLCSTFLSWPIAVVLTIVILLGHWGVMQLGDSAQSGIGNAWAQQLFPNDAPKAKAVSSTVEGLNKALNTVAAVLPDISQYRAAESIQRGVSVPMIVLIDALLVTIGYGLPMAVLAYIFLKNKEVAP